MSCSTQCYTDFIVSKKELNKKKKQVEGVEVGEKGTPFQVFGKLCMHKNDYSYTFSLAAITNFMSGSYSIKIVMITTVTKGG